MSTPSPVIGPKSRRRLLSAIHLGGLSLRDAIIRTWNKMSEHEILTRAAAVSFYAIAALVPFLALVITLTANFFPLIARTISLVVPGAGAGVEHATSQSAEVFKVLQNLLPADAASIVDRELKTIQDRPKTGLISFGVAALIWLASSLFVAVMDAMNRIMGVQETRPFWKVRVTAMLMTLSQAAILIVAFITTLAWPQILKLMWLQPGAAWLASIVQGLIVFLLVLLSFALAMYFGPDADQRWEWITPGSLAGTLILMAVSFAFRFYVQTWGNYSATYGSLAGVVVLTSWLWITSVVLLATAEFNKVIEDASPLGKPYGQRHESMALPKV